MSVRVAVVFLLLFEGLDHSLTASLFQLLSYYLLVQLAGGTPSMMSTSRLWSIAMSNRDGISAPAGIIHCGIRFCVDSICGKQIVHAANIRKYE
jgi:hypothetical protein